MTRSAVLCLTCILAVATLPAGVVSQINNAPSISFAAGASQYDLSGTGTVSTLSVRADLPLSRIARVEAGIGYTRPEQQFGGRSTLLIPEAQLQLQWPLGRVAPYLGVGGGIASESARREIGGRQTSMTLSGAAGVRLAVTPLLGLRTEMRVRGIGSGFEGAAAEYTLGLAWAL